VSYPPFRGRDRHGRELELEEVFAAQARRIQRRLKEHDARRHTKALEGGGELVVEVRGVTQGGCSSKAIAIQERSSTRPPLL
jgi:hypothetical protein